MSGKKILRGLKEAADGKVGRVRHFNVTNSSGCVYCDLGLTLHLRPIDGGAYHKQPDGRAVKCKRPNPE